MHLKNQCSKWRSTDSPAGKDGVLSVAVILFLPLGRASVADKSPHKSDWVLGNCLQEAEEEEEL